MTGTTSRVSRCIRVYYLLFDLKRRRNGDISTVRKTCPPVLHRFLFPTILSSVRVPARNASSMIK